MTESERLPCTQCGEPVALQEPDCPRCGASLLVDVVLSGALVDGRLRYRIARAVQALPGLGIVAAVLGVVITMEAIGGAPETIGQKVAAALVGLTTLAMSVGEEPDTLEEVHEPFLIQQGLIERTRLGRQATVRSFEILGAVHPGSAGPGKLL